MSEVFSVLRRLLPQVRRQLLPDPVPPLLVLQCCSSSAGPAVNEDGEEEVLEGSLDQITPVTAKRSSKETRDTEDILNLFKMGNKRIQKTLEQINSTLSASTPDLKKSWCLWMEASVKDIDSTLWRSSLK